MKCMNNYIAVEFDREYQKTRQIEGGITLIKPDQWLYTEGTETNNGAKYDTQRDLKEVNSQIATVVAENYTVDERTGNRRCSLRTGQKIFVHFLEYDRATPFDVDGKEHSFIDFRSVFFVIHGDGDYEMTPDTYLSEPCMIESPKTESGIFLCSDEALKRDSLKVRITHAPKDGTAEYSIGDIIICTDSFDYRLKVDGREYIKLTSQWMTSKLVV